MRGRLAVVGNSAVLSGVSLPPEDVAIAIDPDDHPAIAAMLASLGIEAAVMRPDFYCFGAVSAGSGGSVAGLMDAVRRQSHG